MSFVATEDFSARVAKLIQESLSHQLTAYLSDFYLTFLLTFE